VRRTLLIGILATACGGGLRVSAPPGATANLGDAWYEHRGRELGISVDEARRRDVTLPEEEPPESYGEDERLARESAVLWATLCAQCHGPEGEPAETLQMDPPPRRWGTFGTSMGFFFGGDKMRAGIYRRIRDGGEPREGVSSAMPPWGAVLSREQIWGLVAHIEGF
jgi:mono/diheme cytochrome c family protein